MDSIAPLLIFYRRAWRKQKRDGSDRRHAPNVPLSRRKEDRAIKKTNKPRQLRNWRGLMKKIPAATYSCGTYRPTTIGAAAFHFRVRNGTGWDHCALATGLQGEEFFIFFILPAREPLGGL